MVKDAWDNMVESIYRNKGVVVVLGASDTGKTTLIKLLLSSICTEGEKVALIDGDIGQSTLGPPTTISMAIFHSPPLDLKKVQPLAMYFVGSISPVNHMLDSLIGLKKLLDKALKYGSSIIIIDTTGLVKGDSALKFKFQKMELLNPNHIIAIQRHEELEALLELFSGRDMVKIYRLPVNENVEVKTPEARRAYRKERYREYLKQLNSFDLSMDKVRIFDFHLIRNTISNGPHKYEDTPNPSLFNGLLLGLNDIENFSLGLGILVDLDIKKGIISFLTPLSNIDRVKIIKFGSVKIDPLGGDRILQM